MAEGKVADFVLSATLSGNLSNVLCNINVKKLLIFSYMVVVGRHLTGAFVARYCAFLFENQTQSYLLFNGEPQEKKTFGWPDEGLDFLQHGIQCNFALRQCNHHRNRERLISRVFSTWYANFGWVGKHIQ